MAMTAQEAAAILDGNKYGSEGTPELFKAMKNAGLVAVFGASDDLMEFRGAIRDEVGCYNGGTAHLTSEGLLTNDCENDDCPHFAKLKKNATTIDAVWDRNGYSWQYDTPIPNTASFVIKEDDQPYCEGIVFKLADADMTHPDRAIEAGARAAARVNGDDYDAIPADKPEWTRESGHFGGRFRDINEPFKSGYEEMAEAVITAYKESLAAEGLVVVPVEPTSSIIKAYIAADPRRKRYAATAKRDYRAMHG